MTDLLAIDHQDHGTAGRYSARLPSGEEAEMTYHRRAPGVLVFDHTLVPDAFRGQGIALRLVERGIADARAAGAKIVPQCPYVAAQFRRHPEWRDLLAET
jgi:uncharacterized protein